MVVIKNDFLEKVRQAAEEKGMPFDIETASLTYDLYVKAKSEEMQSSGLYGTDRWSNEW